MEMYLKLRLSDPKNQRNIVAGVLNDNEERKTGHDQGVESVSPANGLSIASIIFYICFV